MSAFNLKKYIPQILHNKIVKYVDQKNRECFVRILSYIDGNMYAKSKICEHTEKSLGKLLALQSNQLKSFIKNQAIRKLEWNPSDIRWTKKFINLFKGVNKNIIIKLTYFLITDIYRYSSRINVYIKFFMQWWKSSLRTIQSIASST